MQPATLKTNWTTHQMATQLNAFLNDVRAQSFAERCHWYTPVFPEHRRRLEFRVWTVEQQVKALEAYEKVDIP